MPIDLICLDADDTLWHNMRFFHATQDALVRMLEPFADAGIARSSLEACEIRNLKLYGYGAKAFTLSMIETALELGGDDVPATVIRDILEAGKALHAHPVELFEGVEETLAGAGRAGPAGAGDQGRPVPPGGQARRLGPRRTFLRHRDRQRQEAGHIFRHFRPQWRGARQRADGRGFDALRHHSGARGGAWAAYIPQPLGWSHEQRPAPSDDPRFVELPSLAALVNWLDRAEAA